MKSPEASTEGDNEPVAPSEEKQHPDRVYELPMPGFAGLVLVTDRGEEGARQTTSRPDATGNGFPLPVWWNQKAA